MAYRGAFSGMGFQPITESSTTQKHNLGSRVHAHEDSGKGDAAFVYAKGVASTVVGDVVTFGSDFATALLGVGAVAGLPCGVAMSANGAGGFGWYAVEGRVPARANAAVAAGANAYATASPGAIDDAVIATDLVDGIVFAAAAAGAGLVDVILSEPTTTA